jgi:hypothetical protein
MTVTYVWRRRSKWFRLAILSFIALTQGRALASDFKFDRETFAFQNSTVFDYEQGQIRAHKEDPGKEKPKRYTRRCFVMSRTTLQFHKFARFDPRGAPLDDKELAARVRALTRQRPWHDALPAEERIVFPGYPDLRAMSEKRGRLLQQNIGLGWPVYLRLGNTRMFYRHDEKYQEQTHAHLEAALNRSDFFVAYLSSYPYFTINHSVLVYARKPIRSNNGIDHYLVYDPNHPDAPRELKWSTKMRVFNYQKDEEFVGGFTRAFQVYGKPWQ